MTQGTSSLTTFANNFKTLYDDRVLYNLLLRKSPFMGMIPKKNDFSGQYHKWFVQTGRPNAGVHNFSNAQTYRSSSNGVQFQMDVGDSFGVVRIDEKSWKRSKNDRGAFFDLKRKEVSGMLEKIRDTATFELFRDGTGLRGIIADVTTTRITLATPEDAIFFEPGMEFEAYTSGGSQRTGTATVTAVDPENGYIDTDSNWSSQITSIAAGDYLYEISAYGNALSGLEAWLPNDTQLAAESTFMGVTTRAANRIKLAGYWYDGTGKLVTTAIKKACHRGFLFNVNGEKKGQIVAFCNPLNYEKAEDEISNKEVVQLNAVGVNGKKIGDIGYDAIAIRTPIGKIPLVADPFCQLNEIWVLNLATWELKSMGGFPFQVEPLVRDDAMEIEIRCGHYSEVKNIAPGNNIRVTTDDPTA
jgi:hypothetical protein